jgi:hypothetical protein
LVRKYVQRGGERRAPRGREVVARERLPGVGCAAYNVCESVATSSRRVGV